MDTNGMIARTRELLGIDNDGKDGMIKFIVEDCINAVVSYCRLEFLPSQLESYIPFIASRVYRMEGIGSDTVAQSVKSVSEGNRTVSYERCVDMDSIIDEYKTRLKPFVNRKGRVPSDI